MKYKEHIPKTYSVSVCIPVHNGDCFLLEALESINQQDYENIEVIISDNHSTDGTSKIINEFLIASKFPIKVIKPRTFLSAVDNWNFCISNATGSYIKVLFADDYLLPDCVSKMLKTAQSDPEIGFVYCPMEIINSGGETEFFNSFKTVNEDSYKFWSDMPEPVQQGKKYLSDPKLFSGPLNKFGGPSNILYSTDALGKAGLFNPRLNQLVDFQLLLRLLLNYKVGFINESLAVYRIHGKQLTKSNASRKNNRELIKIYRYLLTHLSLFFSLSLKSQLIVLRRAAGISFSRIFKPL